MLRVEELTSDIQFIKSTYLVYLFMLLLTITYIFMMNHSPHFLLLTIFSHFLKSLDLLYPLLFSITKLMFDFKSALQIVTVTKVTYFQSQNCVFGIFILTFWGLFLQ